MFLSSGFVYFNSGFVFFRSGPILEKCYLEKTNSMYVRLAALDTLKMLSCKSKVHEAVLVIAFQSFLQNKERYNNLTQLVNRKVRLKDLFPKSFIKPNLTLTSLLQNKEHYTIFVHSL